MRKLELPLSSIGALTCNMYNIYTAYEGRMGVYIVVPRGAEPHCVIRVIRRVVHTTFWKASQPTQTSAQTKGRLLENGGTIRAMDTN